MIICGPWWLVIPVVLIWWLWRYTDPNRPNRPGGDR